MKRTNPNGFARLIERTKMEIARERKEKIDKIMEQEKMAEEFIQEEIERERKESWGTI